MDPIHPILPQPVNIPPVMPSKGVGRIDRDSPRDGSDDQQAKREGQRRRGESMPDADGQDEARPHVDITA